MRREKLSRKLVKHESLCRFNRNVEAYSDLTGAWKLMQVVTWNRSSKKKRANFHVPVKSVSIPDLMDQIAENEAREKLSKHFLLLHGIQESERLESELDQTTFTLNLYERYKKQKKRNARSLEEVHWIGSINFWLPLLYLSGTLVDCFTVFSVEMWCFLGED